MSATQALAQTPELRLVGFIRAELGRPFIWGDTNCLALSLRALDAMHGTLLHARHRHRMSSAARAQAWTRANGAYGVIVELVREGFTEVPPAFAQPGDVLIGLTASEVITAHVCTGPRALSSTEVDGVVHIPLASIEPRGRLYAAGWRPA